MRVSVVQGVTTEGVTAILVAEINAIIAEQGGLDLSFHGRQRLFPRIEGAVKDKFGSLGSSAWKRSLGMDLRPFIAERIREQVGPRLQRERSRVAHAAMARTLNCSSLLPELSQEKLGTFTAPPAAAPAAAATPAPKPAMSAAAPAFKPRAAAAEWTPSFAPPAPAPAAAPAPTPPAPPAKAVNTSQHSPGPTALVYMSPSHVKHDEVLTHLFRCRCCYGNLQRKRRCSSKTARIIGRRASGLHFLLSSVRPRA